MSTRPAVRSNAQPVIAAVSMLLCATGCNVGRELVDRSIGHRAGSGIDCMLPPKCDASIPDFQFDGGVASGATPVSFNDCDGGLPRCAPVASTDAGVDAGLEPTPGACSPDQPPGALEDAELDCKNLRVRFDANSKADVVRGASLSNVNLAFSSTSPRTLTLEASSLVHVFIRLEGAVTLRITGALELDDVGIAGRANADGAPQLAIVDASMATRLVVGEPGSAFEGELVITRGRLDHTRLSADMIELSSVRADTIAISGGSVLATDTSLQSATLELGNAAFSSSHLNDVHVLNCDALALISSSVVQCELAACRNEPLRAYSSNVSDTTVDGSIDSDASSWSGVRFGLHAPTEVLGWGTTIASATFCAHSSALRLGADANLVKCSGCAAGALPIPICALPTGRVAVVGNYCAALQPEHMEVPDCDGGPFPARPRPQ